MTGTAVATRVELAKVGAQRRTALAAAVCFLVPVVAGTAFRVVPGLPRDTLFGRHLHESGYAFPLVVLGFAATWALPLLAAVIAGNVFAGEDLAGTWGLLLTRSVTRSRVFVGKVLAAGVSAVGLLVAAAGGSVVGGFLLVGGHPLIGLGGQEVPSGRALLLVLGSWASEVPPVLAFAALGCLLSLRTRSTLAGVGGPVIVGLLCTLVALVDGLGVVRDLLPTTPMFAWRGLWFAPATLRPLWQGALVCLLWTAAFLVPAARCIQRRDEAGQ